MPKFVDVVCSSCLLIVFGFVANVGTSVSANNGPRTGYACEGTTLKITCRENMRIRILTANYGRLSDSICHERGNSEGWNLNCMSTRALGVIAQIDYYVTNGMLSLSPSVRPWIFVAMATQSELNQLLHDCCVNYLLINVSNTLTHCHKLAAFTHQRLLGTRKKRTFDFGLNEKRTQAKAVNSYDVNSFAETEDTVPKHLPPQKRHSLTISRDSVTPSHDSVTPSTDNAVSVNPASNPLNPSENEARVQPTRHSGYPSTLASTSETPVTISELHCPPMFRRNASWPATPAGEIAYVECPNNQNVKAAFWRCGLDPVGWRGKPNVSQCVSQKVGRLQQKMQEAARSYSQSIVEEVAKEIMVVSHQETFGGDVHELTEVMSAMVDTVDKNLEGNPLVETPLIKKVNEAVMFAGSNVLAEHQAASWHDMAQADQAQTATRLVSSVEGSAFQVAKTMSNPETIIHPQINIVLEINIIKTDGHRPPNVMFPRPEVVATCKGHQDWLSQGNSFQLTGNTIKELGVDGLARVIFLSYNNLENWLQPQADANSFHDDDSSITFGQKYDDGGIYETPEEKEVKMENRSQEVISKVISASINGRSERQPLAEPITYTLEHTSHNNIYNPSCAFWEYSEKTLDGKWSTQDCKMVATNTTHTVCQCTHLTNFAILLDVHGVEMSDANKFGLSFITYACCIVSVVCLLMGFLTFACFKNLQCDRNTIHKNLVLCLFLAQVIFLGGIFQFDKPVLCAVVAGLLHYFFLASFAWMCVEGIQLYVMLIEVFESEKSRVKYYYLAAYGLPALVVGISAAVDHKGYGTDQHCWLNSSTGFIWAFVGPVIAVIAVNLVMLGIAIYMMCKHANATAAWKMKQKSKLENIRSWVKGAVVLVVLLGLTWSFGLLYMNKESTVMAYIFTVLNTLQGLFIYIFHCVMNDKVQKEYKKCIRHASWLPNSFRIKYGGARPYSSTPNQSTSSGNHKLNTSSQEHKVSFEYLSRLLSKRRKRSSTTSLPKSTSSGKPPQSFIQGPYNPKHGTQRDSAESGIGSQQDDASAIYSEPTEDPNGYLEPVQLRMTDPMDIYHEISLMEGSIVDTDYMFNNVPPAVAALDVDKYKIKRDSSEAEEKPLLSQVEADLIGRKATLCKAESDDSLHKSPMSSMNDLDKSLSSTNINLSSTNINLNADRDEKCRSKDLDFMADERKSDDDAVEKLKTALSKSGDGLITLYQGRTPEKQRLSKDTQEALDQHHYRLTSSDC
ncbi:hypothetical protein CAPTEDRAFT_226868 [Capitella teleta]|uniref:Uncharacterized protein n=1 Tax=Capitella teleta TaxID=283909 RepID=R7V6E1_CAPTE|nr:hypothetical protein CAPTEDRAFT_226868 [Capitella teleta]|eukprot:ELU11325.1 hypothetical protein CAPTEDRAFT_226868 [Capitella teleta]